jgi:hypothetical protein
MSFVQIQDAEKGAEKWLQVAPGVYNLNHEVES